MKIAVEMFSKGGSQAKIFIFMIAFIGYSFLLLLLNKRNLNNCAEGEAIIVTKSEGVVTIALNSSSSATHINSTTYKDDGYKHPPVEFLHNGTEIFLEAARSFSPVTDKVTTHSYQTMYGRFLLPYYYVHPKMKFLEIGLGCDMNYGPGASVALWKNFFLKLKSGKQNIMGIV